MTIFKKFALILLLTLSTASFVVYAGLAYQFYAEATAVREWVRAHTKDSRQLDQIKEWNRYRHKLIMMKSIIPPDFVIKAGALCVVVIVGTCLIFVFVKDKNYETQNRSKNGK
jgi:hypothetical protein